MMLVEVHHLESVELIGHSLDLFCFTFLNRFHAFCIPGIGQRLPKASGIGSIIFTSGCMFSSWYRL